MGSESMGSEMGMEFESEPPPLPPQPDRAIATDAASASAEIGWVLIIVGVPLS